MMWDPSGLASLSLGRLCSCSGSSESPAEPLRLRVDVSCIEDDISVRFHLNGRDAAESFRATSALSVETEYESGVVT